MPKPLEQQRGRARDLDLVMDRPRGKRRDDSAGEPLELVIKHESTPELEDVGSRADQSRALEHARLSASRIQHDLRSGAPTRLESAHAEVAEAPVAAPQQRRVRTEQRPVEVYIQAAHAARDRSTRRAGAGRHTGPRCRSFVKPSRGRDSSRVAAPMSASFTMIFMVRAPRAWFRFRMISVGRSDQRSSRWASPTSTRTNW